MGNFASPAVLTSKDFREKLTHLSHSRALHTVFCENPGLPMRLSQRELEDAKELEAVLNVCSPSQDIRCRNQIGCLDNPGLEIGRAFKLIFLAWNRLPLQGHDLIAHHDGTKNWALNGGTRGHQLTLQVDNRVVV